jgi:hypothetical protein
MRFVNSYLCYEAWKSGDHGDACTAVLVFVTAVRVLRQRGQPENSPSKRLLRTGHLGEPCRVRRVLNLSFDMVTPAW